MDDLIRQVGGGVSGVGGGGRLRGQMWWPWARVGINAGLFAVAAGTMMDASARSDAKGRGDDDSTRSQIMASGINATNAIAWPVLFDMTVGYDKIIDRPILMLGFTWPSVMGLFDGLFLMDMPPATKAGAIQRSNALNMDAQAIISAAFAMGALLSNLKSAAGTHVIMYALIMSLALVIPSVATPSHTQDHVFVQAGQKAALADAIAFVLSGITMDTMSGGASNPTMHRIAA